MKVIDAIWNQFLFQYYDVKVGTNLRCDGKIIIQGRGGGYVIGNNVHIISKEFLNPVGGGRTVLQTIEGGKIVIGNNVGLSHAILCAREEIVIEDNVLIGGGVKIYDNDFHSVEYEYRMEQPDRHIKKKPIRIKEGAFIGAHSIILKGVVIGEYAVIGAGSVVSRSVPAGEIWAGNPARYIRKVDD